MGRQVGETAIASGLSGNGKSSPKLIHERMAVTVPRS